MTIGAHALNKRSQVTYMGKISAQRHTIVKQIYFPSGSVLFLSLFSLSKNWMHNVVWGCDEILPDFAQKPTDFDHHELL